MTPELIAILSIGIGLYAQSFNQGRRLDRRIDRLEEQINERFAKVDERFRKLEERMAAMEIQQAKLEGLLEGLREAITRPHAA